MTGSRFGVRRQGRLLLADDMGLGKTVAEPGKRVLTQLSEHPLTTLRADTIINILVPYS